MTRLLVSVRSAAEAEAALTGGAGLIDVKEPAHGALGRADEAIIADVVGVVAGRAPVSAALGELRDNPQAKLPACLSSLAFVKCGLAACATEDGWRSELDAGRTRQDGPPRLSHGRCRLRRLAGSAVAAAGRDLRFCLSATGMGLPARHVGQKRPNALRLDEPRRTGSILSYLP